MVFWEHENDICSLERIADLMSEEEYRERRRLFFQAMRRDDMRLLRLALRYIKQEYDVEWREIRSIDIWSMRYPEGVSILLGETGEKSRDANVLSRKV